MALLLLEIPTAAQTSPIVIRQLGRYPVIGSVPSTARLRAHRQELLAAAKTLPLTQGEYDALDAELTDPKVLQYGPIPRHLDATTSGPAPYHALHNVTIPPHQYGWHLTYSHGMHRSDIYIPNACGNVSIVRSVHKVRVLPYHAVHAAAPLAAVPHAPEAAPAAAPQPMAAPAAVPTPGPNKKFFARYWPVLVGLVAVCVSQVRVGDFRLCSFGGHGSQATPAPKPSVTSQPGPPPHTPSPHPSASPVNSPTPLPTATPIVTPTPLPSATPTPMPPTPTPKPTKSPCPSNAWCHSPPPSPTPPPPTPTPKPTKSPCPSNACCRTPAPSPSPHGTATPPPAPAARSTGAQKLGRTDAASLVKAALKGWGVFSSPKSWNQYYFSWDILRR